MKGYNSIDIKIINETHFTKIKLYNYESPTIKIKLISVDVIYTVLHIVTVLQQTQ